VAHTGVFFVTWHAPRVASTGPRSLPRRAGIRIYSRQCPETNEASSARDLAVRSAATMRPARCRASKARRRPAVRSDRVRARLFRQSLRRRRTTPTWPEGSRYTRQRAVLPQRCTHKPIAAVLARTQFRGRPLEHARMEAYRSQPNRQKPGVPLSYASKYDCVSGSRLAPDTRPGDRPWAGVGRGTYVHLWASRRAGACVYRDKRRQRLASVSSGHRHRGRRGVKLLAASQRNSDILALLLCVRS